MVQLFLLHKSDGGYDDMSDDETVIFVSVNFMKIL